MLEQHLLSAMISAESRNNFFIACAYGTTYATFLGVDEVDLPQKPMENTSVIITQEKWQTYYFQLLITIVTKMKTNLTEVRQKYGKQYQQPSIIKTETK